MKMKQQQQKKKRKKIRDEFEYIRKWVHNRQLYTFGKDCCVHSGRFGIAFLHILPHFANHFISLLFANTSAVRAFVYIYPRYSTGIHFEINATYANQFRKLILCHHRIERKSQAGLMTKFQTITIKSGKKENKRSHWNRFGETDAIQTTSIEIESSHFSTVK